LFIGLWVVLATMLGATQAMGQTACFTVNNTSVCTDQSIFNFTNCSSGAVSYCWDFGDGLGSSNLPDPTYSYTVMGAGTYTVILQACDAANCQGNCDTTAMTITVDDYQAGFTGISLEGCGYLIATFMDTTSSLQAAISWAWDFSYDGVTFNTESNSGPNVGYYYSAPGIYTVAMISSNAFGCSDTAYNTAFITVHDLPSAGFTVDTTVSCDYPFTVTFTDTTAGAASWEWDVDNKPGNNWSTDYTTQTFSHTYTDTGCYNVALVVTDINGCLDTVKMENLICIAKPVAEFIADTIMDTSDLQLPFVTEGCVPLKVHFLDQSIFDTTLIKDSIVSWYWDFGDGYTIMGGNSTIPDSTNGCLTYCTYKNPTHIYVDTGRFTVTLAIETSLGCNDTITMYETYMCQILGGPCTVDAGMVPFVDFTVSDTVGCHPFTTEFADLSSSFANNWAWDFDNDGTPDDNQQNPAYTYYQDIGFFDVSLITKFNGCKSEILVKDSKIQVLGPRPEFSVKTFKNNLWSDDMHFCFEDSLLTGGWNVQIRDTSNGPPDIWVWDLGDTNTTKVIDTTFYIDYNTLFVDADTAIFPVDTFFFKAGDSNTCGTTYYVIKPADTLTFDADTVPPVPLKDTVHITGDLMHWLGMPMDTNLFGIIGIEMIPPDTTLPDTTFVSADTIFSGLCDTIYIPEDTIIDPPFPLITDSMWKALPFEHTYYTPGTKTIWLYTWKQCPTCPDSLCVDSTSRAIYISKIDAEFTRNQIFGGDTAGCAPFGVFFEDVTTTVYDSIQRIWDFGDGFTLVSPLFPFLDMPIPPGTHPTACQPGGSTTGSYKQVNHVYCDPGTYTVKMTIIDMFGCTDSVTHQVIVNPLPTPQIVPDTSLGCVNDPVLGNLAVTFTDTVNHPSQIDYWVWNYGDGSPSDTTYIPVTQPHTYATCNTFSATLTAVDLLGCKNQSPVVTFIQAICPTASFMPISQSVCSGVPLTFISMSIGTGLTHTWEWFDSTAVDVTTSTSIQHAFNVDTTTDFRVSLTITDTYGCSDTVSYTITIEQPLADFVGFASDTDTTCPNTFQFEDASSLDVTAWSWSFGDGNSSNLAPPVQNTYILPGSYDISLTVTTANNCTDDTIKLDYIVAMGNPPVTGNINGPTLVIQMAQESYSISQTIGSVYSWIVGGGSILSGQGTNLIQVEWGNAGTGQVAVVETTSSGCIGDTVTLEVQIGSSTGVDGIGSLSTIFLHPNPTTGILTIEGAAETAAVYDIYGRLVLTTNTNILDISQATRGIYFVRVLDEQGKMFVAKVLKE